MEKNDLYIYGKHPVSEALKRAPQAIKALYLGPGMQDDSVFKPLLTHSRVSVENLTARTLPRELEGVVHQGALAVISPDHLVRPYDAFVSTLEATPDTALVILGEVQDPQNVGAIIRSAAAFGIAGILIPEHNQAPVTGTVIKASAGMAFSVPLVSIGNVNTTVRDLKERGFWVYGLDGEAPNTLTKEKFDAPAVFIVGNEGKGIRLKTRELCDVLLSIPMSPDCESLNASASTAIALYAWNTQHPSVIHKQ